MARVVINLDELPKQHGLGDDGADERAVRLAATGAVAAARRSADSVRAAMKHAVAGTESAARKFMEADTFQPGPPAPPRDDVASAVREVAIRQDETTGEIRRSVEAAERRHREEMNLTHRRHLEDTVAAEQRHGAQMAHAAAQTRQQTMALLISTVGVVVTAVIGSVSSDWRSPATAGLLVVGLTLVAFFAKR